MQCPCTHDQLLTFQDHLWDESAMCPMNHNGTDCSKQQGSDVC